MANMMRSADNSDSCYLDRIQLTDTVNERRTLFPIQNVEQFEFYKKALASFWTPEEVDLDADSKQFQTLDKRVQQFLKMVLGFFASADSIVAENIAQRFMRDPQISMEAFFFYGFQIMIENVHSEVYSLFIETLIKDPEEKQATFSAVQTQACIRAKTEWAQRYVESDASFATRLVAFACVEGIFFSASFCAIFYMKKQGLMPGLCFSNELIARDEGMHRDFACLLLRERANAGHTDTLSRELVHQIVREAVDIEHLFVDHALQDDLLGMNATAMKRYIELCADHLLSNIMQDRDTYGTKTFTVDEDF
eukprot:gene23925-29030_t